MAATTPICDFGQKAIDFSLTGIDGKTYALADVAGPKGTLVIFMCNHCPYVRAIIDRLVRDVNDLAAHGVGAVAIMPNDAVSYPDDSFDNMKLFAAQHRIPFPYLIDETQAVARAYGAVCTPDFFGYNAALELQYRGRLDASRAAPAPADAPRELYTAMVEIAKNGRGPAEQQASMGCSIKWKRAA